MVLRSGCLPVKYFIGYAGRIEMREISFNPYVMAVKEAYDDERQVRIGIIAGRPITGKVKSVSQSHCIIENEYSETVIGYEEIRFVTAYKERV